MTQGDPEPTADAPSPAAYDDFERDGWRRAAGRYVGSFERVTGEYASVLLDALELSRGRELLDVACGAGALTGAALARGLRVTSVDFTSEMVEQARARHPAATLLQADAEALPFPGREFDGIGINFGMLHFSRPQVALGEARRVLRPGGRVAFTVWATPADNRLQGAVFDALRSLGGARPQLPPPPEGLVQDPQTCRELLARAGFADAVVQRCRRVIAFRDSEEHLRVLLEGTVQTAATLAGLSPAVRQELLERLTRGESSGNPAGIEVESVAWLATAVAP